MATIIARQAKTRQKTDIENFLIEVRRPVDWKLSAVHTIR
jgi:hypothetical protein